eukprot:c17086_g1_i2 orf=150-398(-)
MCGEKKRLVVSVLLMRESIDNERGGGVFMILGETLFQMVKLNQSFIASALQGTFYFSCIRQNFCPHYGVVCAHTSTTGTKEG